MRDARWPTEVGSTRWIVTLASMTGLVALSVDMNLPAQPTISTAFDVSSETVQLNLSLFMLGFAAAQLFVGYLSDLYGRRRVLLAGLAVFTAAAIGCALSPNIELLLVFRVIQGVGGAAAPVVARAMVRDTHPAAQAARLMSVMLATLAVAPMIAPTIGGLLLRALGWRSIFWALALFGTSLMVLADLTLRETLPAERRLVSRSLGGLVRGFAEFFRTPGTVLPMLIGCASFTGQFAYIADSPFVLLEGYRVSTTAFGFYFASTAFALMIGSLVGARMIRAGRSPGGMILTGTSLLLIGGILITLGTWIEGFGIVGFLAPMVLFFFGVGISGPSATALSLEPVPHIAGTASSMIGFSMMTSGALAGYLTTLIGGSDPRIFAVVVTVTGALACGLAIAAVTRARRRPA